MKLAFGVILAIIFGCLAIIASRVHAQDCAFGTFGCGHAEHHAQYKDWHAPNGTRDCCGDQDCRPILSRFNGDIGLYQIWIPEFRRWVDVPPNVVDKPDKFGDGHAHACTTPPNVVSNGLGFFYVFCFSPTGSKG